MKKILMLGLAVFSALGCSKTDWLAKFYVVKAENAYSKGYVIRLKKVPYEERLKYYRAACSYFLKAYHLNPDVFTLERIGAARESCMRVKDAPSEEEFIRFEEKYAKGHPTEAEYGDSVPPLQIE